MLDTVDRIELAANRLIESLMKAVLDQSPGATRVRLALICDDIGSGNAGAEAPRYEVTNSVAVRGRPIGLTPRNQPLSDWDAFLPALLAGECALELLPRDAVPARTRRGAAAVRGIASAGRMTSTLACPATTADGRMAGALFILWDGRQPPPAANRLDKLITAARYAAIQIARVWDVCGGGCPNLTGRARGVHLQAG